MSSHNPLMPQGSLEEQKPRNKSNVYIAVFAILTFHVILLGALLLQGCKKTPNLANNNDPTLTPTPTNTGNGQDIGMLNPFAPSNSNSNPVSVQPPPPPPPIGPMPGPGIVDTTQPPPAATGGAQIHVVAAKDSFSTIGKKYGVSAAEIATANPGVDSRKLQVGQKIKVPERAATALKPAAMDVAVAPAGTVIYEVKKNDNLIKIAKNQGTTVDKLKAANNLKNNMIKQGQKLKIPAKAEAAPVATPPPTSTSYVTPLPGRTTAAL